MKRISFYNSGINIDYRWRDRIFFNSHFGNSWRCKEEWFFRIAFVRKFFEKDFLNYDGHYVNSVAFLGIELCLGYTYDSRPVIEW